MKKTAVDHVAPLLMLATCFLALLSPPEVVHASASPADSVHFCLLAVQNSAQAGAVFDYEQWQRDHLRPAAKPLGDLNAGEPRTVRMIYFLPNDRPFRQEIVDSMKVRMRRLRTFYAEQMQAHGYGDKTFRFETDARGEPLVHRVDGQHGDSHYHDNTPRTVTSEIQHAFDLNANIYFIVVDHSSDVIGLGGGEHAAGIASVSITGRTGYAMVHDGFSFGVAAHELTHAFGLAWHDFRDNTYVLSYVGGRHRLSACSAGYLATHPYFNPDITLGASRQPTIERVSPARYPAGSERVSIRLQVVDPDGHGLHQVFLFVPDPAGGARKIKACRILSGEKEAVVEFEDDGFVPSSSSSSLFYSVIAIDTDGDVRLANFGIAEDSPYLIATLEGPLEYIHDVALSPDGGTLAVGSNDRNIVLWDIDTREQMAFLKLKTTYATAVAFSPDGSTLASGSQDGPIILWDVATREATPLGRHSSSWVIGVAFSPDGSTLASGSENDIKLWDVAAREEMATIIPDANVDLIRAVAFSPDGSTLAVAGLSGPIVLLDVSAREEIATLKRSRQWYTSVAFSPDGSTLASASGGGKIVLWDVAAREEMRTIIADANAGWVSSVAFSPDGSTLASGTSTGTVVMQNVLSENIDQRFPHTSEPSSVVFSHDGATLVASSTDGRIELWDTSQWLRPRPFGLEIISGDGQQGRPGVVLARPLIVEVRDQYGNPLPDAPVTFTVTAGNGTLGGKFTTERAVTDTHGRVEVFLTPGPNPGANTVGVSLGERELATFRAEGVGTGVIVREEEIRTWHLPDGAIARLGKGTISGSDRAVDFSRDGRYLAVASTIGVWVYEVATSRALALLPTRGPVYSVAFSPDGATLASALNHDRIELWQVQTGARIGTLHRQSLSIPLVVFSSDGATLASGSRDGTVLLWDVASQEEIAVLEGHTGRVRSVAFTPDGRTLASGSDDETIKLWDVSTREEIASLKGHTENVNSVAFSPDGTTLASGSEDATIKLWDVATREEIATLGHKREVNSVAFSPDGNTLASRSLDWTVKLWDVATREKIATLRGHAGRSVAFSPDGTTLAFGSFHTIKLWDVAAREEIASLKGHTGIVTSVAFTPDGATLASGSYYDDTILLWDMSPYITPQTPDIDFDGDGTVGFADFVQFAARFGLSQNDAGYDARYDLDGDGTIGFGDFLIFAGRFGQKSVINLKYILIARYYRSPDATISTSDAEARTDAVDGPAASVSCRPLTPATRPMAPCYRALFRVPKPRDRM